MSVMAPSSLRDLDRELRFIFETNIYLPKFVGSFPFLGKGERERVKWQEGAEREMVVLN